VVEEEEGGVVEGGEGGRGVGGEGRRVERAHSLRSRSGKVFIVSQISPPLPTHSIMPSHIAIPAPLGSDSTVPVSSR